MDKRQIIQLLTIIKGAYPQWARELKADDAEAMIRIWGLGLKNISYELAEQAVIKHCTNSKWIPAVADIVDKVRLMQGLERESEATIMAEITKAICQSYDDEHKAYEKLSNTAKQVIRDPYMIKEWRTCDRFTQIVAPGLRKSIKEQIELNYTKEQLGIKPEQIEYQAKVAIPRKIVERREPQPIGEEMIQEALKQLRGF